VPRPGLGQELKKAEAEEEGVKEEEKKKKKQKKTEARIGECRERHDSGDFLAAAWSALRSLTGGEERGEQHVIGPRSYQGHASEHQLAFPRPSHPAFSSFHHSNTPLPALHHEAAAAGLPAVQCLYYPDSSLGKGRCVSPIFFGYSFLFLAFVLFSDMCKYTNYIM
jgi:hypothetical protein